MAARVIGFGQSAAGDDGVGLAVLQRLREMRVPEGTELLEAREGTALFSLLETRSAVILLDAVVTPQGSVGQVLELDAVALETARGPRAVSTHGLAMGQTIALARLVSIVGVSPSIWVVGVTIAPPRPFVHGLSPAVSAAIPLAAQAVLARLEVGHA